MNLIKHTTLLGLLLTGLTNHLHAQGTNQPPSDTDISQKIVGTWKIDSQKAGGAVSVTGTFKFMTGGKFSTTGIIRDATGRQVDQLTAEGTWVVQGGVVIEKITTTSNSRLAQVGLITRDKVIKIDDKQFVYQSMESGKQETNERVK